MSYDEEMKPQTLAMAPSKAIRPSVTETLQREKANLLERLTEIEEALAVLTQYPDVQKVLDVIAKTTRF